jgi:hypothetical protein
MGHVTLGISIDMLMLMLMLMLPQTYMTQLPSLCVRGAATRDGALRSVGACCSSTRCEPSTRGDVNSEKVSVASGFLIGFFHLLLRLQLEIAIIASCVIF